MRIFKQADELQDLVSSEAPRLETVFPGISERYATKRTAIRSIGRAALNRDLEAFVIRNDKKMRARGIATVILNQSLSHPQLEANQISNAYDVDYWLDSRADADDHISTTTALIEASAKIAARLKDFGPRGRAATFRQTLLATALADGPVLNEGLTERFHPVGNPGTLSFPESDDPLGVTRDGRAVQLYKATINVPYASK